MLQSKPLNFEKLRGTIYDFPEIGDELPKHWHDEGMSHISVVARGSFKAFGNTWEKILTAGDVIDWPSMQTHGFVSLEENSRLVNISKNNNDVVNETKDIDGLL